MDPNYQNTSTIANLNNGNWEPDQVAFWDDSATYYTTSLLNLFIALAFTEGKPFRQSMFKNWVFITWICIWTVYICVTLIAPYTDKIGFSSFNDFMFGYSKIKKFSESFTPTWCSF